MSLDIDALNYPYIRVRSVEWLKRTLLIFPHVVRMTPESSAPADDPDVNAFCWTNGKRGPLLRSADLYAPHVQEAQTGLIRGLDTLVQRRGARFAKRFKQRNTLGRDCGQVATHLTLWERRLSAHPTFQIHRHKMSNHLVDYLLENGFAWEPAVKYSDGPEYLEMNPRLGEAVMATIASACAENEGLQVITEFPQLHGQLIGTPRDSILEACLEDPKPSGETSSRQVVECLVYRRCDVSALTAEGIAALHSERNALVDFRIELEKLAATLPPIIYSEAALEERLNDQVNDLLKRWQDDQANLSAFSRKLFGEGALDEPAKVAQELVKSVIKPESTVLAAAGAGFAGAHVGGLTVNVGAAAAAGFVIAFVFRAIRVWSETRATEKESPFRYLTALRNNGVVFSLARITS